MQRWLPETGLWCLFENKRLRQYSTKIVLSHSWQWSPNEFTISSCLLKTIVLCCFWKLVGLVKSNNLAWDESHSTDTQTRTWMASCFFQNYDLFTVTEVIMRPLREDWNSCLNNIDIVHKVLVFWVRAALVSNVRVQTSDLLYIWSNLCHDLTSI